MKKRDLDKWLKKVYPILLNLENVPEKFRHLCVQLFGVTTSVEGYMQQYGVNWPSVWKWKDTSIMPLPSKQFSLEEYKQFLRDHKELLTRLIYLKTIWKDKSLTDEILDISRQISKHREQYRSNLPYHLLARCPICRQPVFEHIDTYSLNGPGWVFERYRGTGWYGNLAMDLNEGTQERFRSITRSLRPSFHTECTHVQCIDWCVNLSQEKPNEVDYFSESSEVPHLLSRFMTFESVYAVIHTIPIQRIELPNALPFTAFFFTYFSEKEYIADKIFAMLKPDETDNYLLVRPPWDFDLINWVQKGRLFWLDLYDSQILHSKKDNAPFPYFNIPGKKDGLVIKDGKILSPYSWFYRILHKII